MAIQVFAYESVSWTDESIIHDGRLLVVERTASNSLKFELWWPLPPIFRFQPTDFNEHRLEFNHPDTKESVVWNGEPNFKPVRVDVIEGTPYLVIYGRPDEQTAKIYGCPELPYIYLKYIRHDWLPVHKWVPIPVQDAPKELLKVNLSGYDIRSKNGRRFDRKAIDAEIKSTEYHSGGQLQSIIPRSYDEWHTAYKNNARNERYGGDCRPSRVMPAQAPLPLAIEGAPEIIETIEYTPERIAIGDDWITLAFDQKRSGDCKKVFRPTDPTDHMLGQRFMNDSTGGKPAPYSRTAQFDMGVRVLCDDYVWFVTHQEEPGKIVISKFTVTGNLMYRTSFRKPDRIEGLAGDFRTPSLRSEDGYLYFDWLDFRRNYSEWHIKRWLKMRMREPALVGNLQR